MKDKEPIIPEINTHDVKNLNLRFARDRYISEKTSNET